jgi:hypothetical protein
MGKQPHLLRKVFILLCLGLISGAILGCHPFRVIRVSHFRDEKTAVSLSPEESTMPLMAPYVSRWWFNAWRST